MMPDTQTTRRSDRLYRAAAIILAIYGVGEFGDCVIVALMHFGIVPSFSPHFAFADINNLFNTRLISLLPLFLFFASNRVIAAIGLFKRRMWGFWMAIFVSAATIVVAPFLLPLTGSEMILDGLIIFLLLLARFGSQGLKDGREVGG